MSNDTVVSLKDRVATEFRSDLDEIVRQGAQQMLQQALMNEVSEYLERHRDERDEPGHRMVVQSGKMPP
jgi:hypothetical protein